MDSGRARRRGRGQRGARQRAAGKRPDARSRRGPTCAARCCAARTCRTASSAASTSPARTSPGRGSSAPTWPARCCATRGWPGRGCDGARLLDADLRGADLSGARLFRADLSGARTEGSRWNRAAVIGAHGLEDPAAVAGLRGAAVAPGQPVETELAPAVVGVPYGLHYQRARLPQPLAYTGDGSLLVAGSADGGVLLCDTATGLPVRALRGHQGRVYGVSVAAGDEVLATAASDGTIRLWDAATGTCTKVITVAGGGAWPAETSPDGRLLAYGAADGVVRLLDLRSGTEWAALRGHAPPVFTVAFGGSDEQAVVVTGDAAGTIRVWDQATGDLLTQLAGRGGPMFRLLAGHDGLTFAAGGSAGTLLLLRAGGFGAAGFGFGGFSVTELAGHTGGVYALDFHPDQPLLASGDTDGGVRLWDVTERALRAPCSPRTPARSTG